MHSIRTHVYYVYCMCCYTTLPFFFLSVLFFLKCVCVLILLHMYVLIYTTQHVETLANCISASYYYYTHVSSYYYIYVSSYYDIYASSYYYKCPHTTIYDTARRNTFYLRHVSLRRSHTASLRARASYVLK